MSEHDGLNKIDLQYAEESVRFSIANCSIDKKYSFWSITKEEAKKLVKKLAHFETMNWKQTAALPRENGLTSEKRGSESFSLIDNQNSNKDKMLEQHYFHLRIEPRGLFRIFGYQRMSIFYITHIDPKGKIHH